MPCQPNRADFYRGGRRIGNRAVLSAHCHNDLGMAVANSLAAVQAGARQVECTINGIGERAGNASLEEIVMALEVRADALPHRTGIHTPSLVPTSKALSAIIGFGVPPNKAIVGVNAFAHEAGIHQDGMLKHDLTTKSCGRNRSAPQAPSWCSASIPACAALMRAAGRSVIACGNPSSNASIRR